MLGGRRTVNLIKSELLFLCDEGLSRGRSCALGGIGGQRVYRDRSRRNSMDDSPLETRGYGRKVVIVGRTNPQGWIQGCKR